MATTYLSPVGNSAQINANGSPLSGGQIWTYAAGTTNLIATYMDNSGSVGQQNPIPLNASGLPSNPIWLPAGQAVKLVIQDANGVTQRTVDNVTGINDPSGASTADQWVIFSASPTFVSATSFSLGGDQTGGFHVGRRVRTANTGGTVYSTVTASSYNSGTARTTVTVANDSGTLDSGLSQVSYGLLSYTNTSSPGYATPTKSRAPTGALFQCGSSTGTTDSFGVLIVAFPESFASAPVVVPSNGDGVNAPGANVTLQSSSTTGAVFKVFSSGSTVLASASVRINWMAFGK